MAGSLRPDEIQLRVLIDGSPARKELVDLAQLTAKLREEQKKMVEQQSKLRDDKRAAAAKGDAAAVKALAAEEAKLREERGRNATALADAERRGAAVRKEIGLEALSVRELRNELRAAKSAFDAAAPNTEQWVQARTRLDQLNTQLNRLTKTADIQAQVWERIRGQYRLTDMSIEQLEMEIRRLNTAMSTMAPKDPGLARLQGELRATEKQLSIMRSGLGPFGRLWGEVKSQVYGAGAVLGGMLAAGGIVQGFRGLVRSSAELSDALADVRKTTGLSGGAVQALATELGQLDTRTARTELLALARDAGKLGISAKEDVLAFVKAGNQINVALGEDLGADAIKSIAKLVDLFKLNEQFGLEQSMLKVGSAINALGMASTASEGYMVEFLKRMGGIAPIAGITIQQTLALGATLDSLGQTSEVSSTALSKLFVKLGSDAEKYARLAGMSVDAFQRVLKENALEAFIAVLEGTKRTEGGVVALSETLGEMGIDAARAAGVFGVLSQNTGRLREQMDLSNKAFADGSSVTQEYALRNENLAAQMEKLGKEFNKLFANTTVMGWLQGLVQAARDSIAWLTRNKDAVIAFLKLLGTSVAVWASYRLAVATTTRITALAAGATRAFGTVMALFRGQVTAATAATRAFNTVTKLNPLGLLISGITAAIGLLSSFSSAMAEVASGVAQETTALQLLHAQILTTNKGTDERRALIQRLKEMYPEYLANIDADTTSNEELGRAVEFVNQQLINKAILAKADLALEEQNAKAAERKLEAFAREQELRERLVRLSAESGVPLEEAGSTIEQATKFLNAYERTTGKPLLGIDRSLLDKDIAGIRAWEKSFREESDKSSVLVQRRMDLMRQLGMDTAKAAESGAQFNTVTGDASASADQATRSVQFLNDAIKRLQEQQELASDPAKYRALQKQIDALEAERDRITGAKKKERENKEEAHLDKLLAEYQQFQSRLNSDRQLDDEREIAELDAKHKEELDKVKEQQAKLIAARKLTPEQAEVDTTALRGNQASERANLIERQGEDRYEELRQANERIAQLLGDARAERLQNELDAVDEEIQIAQSRGESILELERRKKDILLSIYAQNAEDAILAETEKWQKVIDEAKKRLAEYEAAAGRDGVIDEGEAARIAAQSTTILQLEQSKSDAIEEINRSRRRRERAALRAESRAEREEYARRVQNVAEWANALGAIMGGALQIRDAEIDLAEQRADADGVRTAAEIAGLQQLQEARRRAALTHIAVQAAAAVASAVASAMASPIPFPGNLLAVAPAVATVLGLIAQARALMNSTDASSAAQLPGTEPALQSVPLGADGIGVQGDRYYMAGGGSTIPSKKQRNPGLITSGTGGGVLGGNYHTQGGNTLYDDRTGLPLANVEKDELMLVMSRRATEANNDLIPMLLDASRKGQRLPVLDRPVATPDPQRVQQAMRVAYMADGGALGNTTYTFSKATGLQPHGAPPSDPAIAELVGLTSSLLAEMRGNRAATERIKTLKVSLHDEDRRRTEYERIQSLNKGTRAA